MPKALERLHSTACSALERGLTPSLIRSAILAYVEALEKAGLSQTAHWWRQQIPPKPRRSQTFKT